jgi:flagella basal body P-ring formation protein FlgA
MRLAVLCFLFCAAPVWAQTVVAERTIRPNTIIEAEDLLLKAGTSTQGFDSIADVAGQEARVVLYPGRPIRASDIGPPALITRNQVVRVHFNNNGLSILTEGRALERGAIGDRIRFMNLASRATLFGFVQADGSLRVLP